MNEIELPSLVRAIITVTWPCPEVETLCAWKVLLLLTTAEIIQIQDPTPISSVHILAS